MTIQIEQSKELPTLVEHVLVVGNEKLWAEWVHAQIQEYNLSTHHKDVSRFVVDDTKTAYHFVSTDNGDGHIIERLRGKLFHRWLNLGVEVSQYTRDCIKTRVRLK